MSNTADVQHTGGAAWHLVDELRMHICVHNSSHHHHTQKKPGNDFMDEKYKIYLLVADSCSYFVPCAIMKIYCYITIIIDSCRNNEGCTAVVVQQMAKSAQFTAEHTPYPWIKHICVQFSTLSYSNTICSSKPAIKPCFHPQGVDTSSKIKNIWIKEIYIFNIPAIYTPFIHSYCKKKLKCVLNMLY